MQQYQRSIGSCSNFPLKQRNVALLNFVARGRMWGDQARPRHLGGGIRSHTELRGGERVYTALAQYGHVPHTASHGA